MVPSAIMWFEEHLQPTSGRSQMGVKTVTPHCHALPFLFTQALITGIPTQLISSTSHQDMTEHVPACPHCSHPVQCNHCKWTALSALWVGFVMSKYRTILVWQILCKTWDNGNENLWNDFNFLSRRSHGLHASCCVGLLLWTWPHIHRKWRASCKV